VNEASALVLTYHSIGEDRPPLGISPQRLEAQLDLLEQAGFRPVSLPALVTSLEQGRVLPEPSFCMTFDDGYRDFETHALPILARRRIPATLFVTASADRAALAGGVGHPLVDLEALPGLPDRGVTVGAHSISHVDLTRVDDATLEIELAEGRAILERYLGDRVEHFAYPFGRLDRRVRAAAGRFYRSACTTQLECVPPGQDPLAIPRIDAHYLRSPLLRLLLRRRRPQAYLGFRRRLRRLRGSEPTLDLPASG